MVRKRVLSLIVIGVLAGIMTVPGVRGSITPETNTLTINAGESGTEQKTVGVPEVPAKADIEIAIDTTGSMGHVISQAKSQAVDLVNAVQAQIADAQFAVVDFKDSFDVPEYLVRQSMTSDATAVQTAINAMSAVGGGDFPEAFNLVFNRSHTPDTGGDIGWREATRKFVVVFGDAPPHDAHLDGYPSCNPFPGSQSPDPHGLHADAELAGMEAAQRTLFMVAAQNYIKPCYDELAADAYTGSQAVNLGDDIASQLVTLIQEASASVSDVHLEVVSASPAPADASWISFSPTSAGPLETPATVDFTVTVAVPAGTPAGTYTYDIVALADGGDIGHQTLTVIVPPSNRSPDCSTVTASGELWPPNHQMVPITLSGATDPDGDAVSLTVTGVTQDEPTPGPGKKHAPDATLSPLTVRVERNGGGDGRVYRVAFTGDDGKGGTCTGTALIGIPHDQSGDPAVDSGGTYDSTV